MPSPIFIVGYMHSGTTLLFRMLGRHSALIKSGGETKFFEFLPEIARRFPALDDQEMLQQFLQFTAHTIQSGYHSRQRIAERSHPEPDEAAVALASSVQRELPKDPPSHGQIFATTFDVFARESGKSAWVEKTPTHIFNINEIAAAIPSARFLEIVRDPRDVLASKKTRRSTVWTTNRYSESQRSFKHLEKSYDVLWDTLSWKSAIRAGWNAHESTEIEIYTIRYEDLVTSPAETMRRVCVAMDLPYEPDMLAVNHRNAADPVQKGYGGIATDSIARWRDVLSAGEVATCQAITTAEMKAYDYNVESVGLAATLRVGTHVAVGGVRLVERLYRRWKMGGFGFLRTVVSGYSRRAGMLIRSHSQQ